MHFLIAPDKLKGSLSAREAAEAIERGIRRVFPEADCTLLPLADGGEGLLDAFMGAGAFTPKETIVQDALGRDVHATWLLEQNSDNPTAIIESSQANGLWRIKENERNPLISSTYGVGQMIRAAIAAGAEEILIGLGGSATNDAGLGLAAALGCTFADASGNRVDPIPQHFPLISGFDTSALIPLPPIRVACDVKNPLLGPRGATRIYGPQKGVSPEKIDSLETAMRHVATIAARHFDTDFSDHPGAGAAGGLGYGLMTFCSARLESGFDCIASVLAAETHIIHSDIVITAEGSLDSQTLEGKTPIGVSKLARKHGRPVYALAGQVSDLEMLQTHFDGIDSILRDGISLDHATTHALELLEERAAKLAGRFKA